MAIIENTDVFTILQIEKTPDQMELVDLIIPEIEGDYKRIQNKEFDVDGEGNIVYPEGSKLTAGLMIGYVLNKQYGIQSQSISKYSQSNEATVLGYPKSITDRIKKYPKFM